MRGARNAVRPTLATASLAVRYKPSELPLRDCAEAESRAFGCGTAIAEQLAAAQSGPSRKIFFDPAQPIVEQDDGAATPSRITERDRTDASVSAQRTRRASRKFLYAQ